MSWPGGGGLARTVAGCQVELNRSDGDRELGCRIRGCHGVAMLLDDVLASINEGASLSNENSFAPLEI